MSAMRVMVMKVPNAYGALSAGRSRSSNFIALPAGTFSCAMR